MNDRVDQAMQEVWDWKRKAEDATRGMDRATVIDFYRKQAVDLQQRLGVDLPSQPAGDAARARRQ